MRNSDNYDDEQMYADHQDSLALFNETRGPFYDVSLDMINPETGYHYSYDANVRF